MTDAGAPLSRRERRLRAQQQAEAAEQATSDIPVQGPDGRALSRRERRALERSQQPMETWTAEEEMIATGQLPAMTPEVIAEQEQLARRKADEAAEEAARTSAELRRVSLTDAVQVEEKSADPETTQPPAHPVEPAAEPEAAPLSVSPVELRAPADVVEPDAEVAQAEAVEAAEADPAEAAEAEVPAVEAPLNPAADVVAHALPPEWEQDADAQLTESLDPVVDEDERPTEITEPVTDPAAVGSEPGAVSQAEGLQYATGEQPNAVPESLRHLFPPGSLQARMMADGFAASRTPVAGTPAEPVPATDESAAHAVAERADAASSDIADSDAVSGDSDTDTGDAGSADSDGASAENQLPAESVAAEADDPAEEFRRLTAQAMAGLERAARPTSSPDSGEAVSRVSEAAPGDELEPPATAPSEPVSTAVPAMPEAATEAGRSAEQTSDSGPVAAPSFPPVGAAVPVAAATGGVSARAAQDAEAASQLHAPVRAANPWEHHPLEDAEAPGFDPDDYVPSEQLPRPDLSQLLRPATGGTAPTAAPLGGQYTAYAPPATGAVPQAIAFGQAPTTTGSIPITAAIPVTSGIEVPEEGARLNPAGGARDFRWAHLAVLCAVAFVCGVLVWQLAGPGS